ncbi:MAG: protein kinase [Isosphaeraceae bacterium]
MTVGTPPEFVCPQGHRWRLDDHPAGRSDDERLRCLICGGYALPAARPIGGGEGPSGQPPRHSSNPPPGTPTFPAIPGYAILGVLGRGRAGVVYEARELARDRRVTLEVIESERNGASGDNGLVHLDAGATRLHHPNIVPVLSCGRHDGAEFLVSEFVKGENLREHLEGGPLPVLTAAEVVETLARAVHEAHRLGFRHGDLTAARVLLAPSHPPRFVDPDLGHLCEENGRELIPRITGFGMAGAPGAGRDSDSSVAADVFGLGSILFELLTGQPPRDAESIDRGAAPPSARNPKVPKDLEAICLACLDPDPARRLADAGLLADALRQFLDTFVTHFQCSRCSKGIKSKKPLQVGTTLVRCPSCGAQSLVEPLGGKAPSPSSPERIERHDPAPATPAPETHHDPAPSSTPEAGRLSPSRPAAPPTAPDNSNGPEAGWDSTFAVPKGPAGRESTPVPSSTPRSTPSGFQAAGLPIVSGYVLLSELGRGGMGVVYKAKHEKLKRIVALKMVSIHPQDGSQGFVRFQAEAEAVARLHHPNIVQIFEVGEQDGSPYLALEFVTGGTLKNRLDGRPQPIRAAVQLVQQLARAVHAAHQRGIVHRDLKPANILLQPTPPAENWYAASAGAIEANQVYGVPKVSDFGVAKRIDDGEAPGCYGGIVGTAVYMAPEQAKGQPEEIGPAADIYSLGVILYEMLTGRPPFISSSAVDVLRQLRSDPPVPPRQLRREIPRDLEAICRRCLEKDPRQRYPTAQLLADDLGSFLEGEPVRARPPRPVERLWNWSLKNPVPSTLLLTISAVLLFGQWSLHRLADQMVESTTKEGAAQQTELIKVVNSLYSDVAARAKNAGVVVSHKYPELAGSIPIPAKFTIELGQRMVDLAGSDDHGRGLDQSFLQLKLYSDHPFQRRNDSPPKYQFGKDALAFYRDAGNKDRPFDRIEKTRAGARVLRYATPLIMEERCLKCHNDPKLYELDEFRKTDWKAGDIRGVLEVVCPLADNAEQTQKMLLYTYLQVGGTGAAVLTLSWAGLMLGRRRRRV